jgi:hypothetical protein
LQAIDRAAVVSGVVYIGSNDGAIYAFGVSHAQRNQKQFPVDLKALRPNFKLKVSNLGTA